MTAPQPPRHAARDFFGRRMSGDVTQFTVTRRGFDTVITIRQEKGPKQTFLLFRHRRTRAGRMASALPRTVLVGLVGSLVLAALTLGALLPYEDDSVPDAPITVAEVAPWTLAFLLLAAVFARAYWWTGLRYRHQPCVHAAAIHDALKSAGDPRGQKWAVEAVNALRSNEFCRDSAILHLMADRPGLFEAPLQEPVSPAQQVPPQPPTTADTESDIAALQALRIYSRRWDKNE